MDSNRLCPRIGRDLAKEKHPRKASVPRLKKLTQYHIGPGEMVAPTSDSIPSSLKSKRPWAGSIPTEAILRA